MSGRFKNVFRGSNDPRKFFLPNTDLERKERDFYMFEDKTLICKDCGNEFTFTAGEQESCRLQVL